jgi:transposase
MEKNSLTPTQVAALKTAHHSKKYRKHADRIKVVLFLNEGFSYEETAKLLLLNDSTVRKYEKCYFEKGLDGLLEGHYHGRQMFLTKQQCDEIEQFIDTNHIVSTKQIQNHMKETYRLFYSWEGTRKLLHRLGFCYRKPQTRPCKLNTQKQAEHIQRYNEIKSRQKKENSAIYFADAVHPTLSAKPSYGWMRKGKPKTLLTGSSSKRVNIHGALDIQNQDVITHSADTINANSTIKLLTRIRDKNKHRSKIYVILDNSRSHHSKKVKAWLEWNKKIELVFLPPYSPNLNTIERLWKFMNKKIINNNYYSEFLTFKKSITTFFRRLKLRWNEMGSLLNDHFQTYTPLPCS